MTPRRRAAPLLALLLVSLAAAPAFPEDRPAKKKDKGTVERLGLARPGEAPAMSAGRIEQSSPGEYVLSGDVDFRYGAARLLADTVRYSEATRTVTAEGNVVLQLESSQVSGDRVEVNLDTEHAIVDNARGYFDPDVILQAEKLERIGEKRFRITRGTITTCSQPIPYWSFRVGSATLDIGEYAHMRNVAFRISAAPFFWSPYLVWPIKEDRAPGLLLPHFGFTAKRGAFLSNAIYLPLGRSADATIQIDYFNGAVSGTTEELPQTGGGLELRFVPSATGSGALTGYYLLERYRPYAGAEVVERSRYHFELEHTQRLPSGFKLLMDINTVSDLDYFLDFGREFRYTTTPTVLSQIDLSRQSAAHALNVRFNRQLQFLGVDPGSGRTQDLTLWRLPEIEVRGRGIRLGRTPFYLNYASSLDGLARRTRLVDTTGKAVAEQTTYHRFDIFPTIAGNFTPVPWLDISPVVAFRETWYSASDLDPGPDLDPVGPSYDRTAYRVGMSLVGPRVFRLFGSEEGGRTRYKHTFEPRVSYFFGPEVGGKEKVIPFDEIDSATLSSNVVTYSITSRLFAKRPPKTPAPAATTPALSGSFASLVLGEEAPSRYQELNPPAEPPGAPPGTAVPPAEGPESAGSEAPQGPAPPTGGETYIAPDVSTITGRRTPFGPGRPLGAPAERERLSDLGPAEIATFDITQRYSPDSLQPLSRAATSDLESQFSAIEASLRYNPTYAASLDLRADYDILFHDIRRVSLSGNYRSRDVGYVRLSWFLNRDLEGKPSAPGTSCPSYPGSFTGRSGFDTDRCYADSSQIRLMGGMALLRRKITTDFEGSYDIQEKFLQDQRYRFGYNTQCCGVLIEVAKRYFSTATVGPTSETEYRFVLNLRGVGTFLDLNGRPQ